VGIIVFLAGFVGLFFIFLSKYRDAQDAMGSLPDRLAEASRPPSKVLSADGKELFRVATENRIPLRLNDIPKHVQNAVLAAEDKRFYEHTGVDFKGLMRAFMSIFQEGRVSQGGSTITMQLAKQLYSGSERSFMRKMQDIAFATAMEDELGNKSRILETYLNYAYFGQSARGIGAAAKIYLNKPVSKLTVSDAALLARCVRLPSRENPIRNPKIAMQNRDVVLAVMRDEGMITEREYEKAVAERPRISKKPPATTAFYPAGYGHHFVQYVLDEIERADLGIDLKAGGYVIHTTLDSKAQRLGEKVVADIVRKNRFQKVNSGAFVAMDSRGRILCMVGSHTDFQKSQYNFVTQGRMQPGSAFKPIVYATAMREGVISGPEDSVSNAFISLPGGADGPWQPKNASASENAPFYSVRTALAISVNRPAIHTILKVGPATVAQTARDSFGIRSKLDPYPPLALGSTAVSPLEMAEAYSVFMLRGDRVRPFGVIKIVSPDGTVVKEFSPERQVGAFDARIATEIDSMLRSVVDSGTGRAALVVPNAKGKTGTTNSAKDAWFCGYADNVLGIGWVGNQQKINGRWKELPMGNSVYGGTVTIKIWTAVMQELHKKYGKKLNYTNPGTVAAIATPKPRREREEPAEDGPFRERDRDRDRDVTEDEPETPRRTSEDETPPVRVPPVEPAVQPRDEEEAPVRTTEPATTVSLDEPERREPPRPRREEPGVSLEICVDTGQRASIYCPETISRTFSRGNRPRRTCRVHGSGD